MFEYASVSSSSYDIDGFVAKLLIRIALLPLVMGLSYELIRFAARRQPHKLTPFAKVEGTRVWYPGLSA